MLGSQTAPHPQSAAVDAPSAAATRLIAPLAQKWAAAEVDLALALIDSLSAAAWQPRVKLLLRRDSWVESSSLAAARSGISKPRTHLKLPFFRANARNTSNQMRTHRVRSFDHGGDTSSRNFLRTSSPCDDIVSRARKKSKRKSTLAPEQKEQNVSRRRQAELQGR